MTSTGGRSSVAGHAEAPVFAGAAAIGGVGTAPFATATRRDESSGLGFDVTGHVVPTPPATRVYICGPALNLDSWLGNAESYLSLVSYADVNLPSMRQFIGAILYKLFWAQENRQYNELIAQSSQLEEGIVLARQQVVDALRVSDGLPDARGIADLVHAKQDMERQLEETQGAMGELELSKDRCEIVSSYCCRLVQLALALNSLNSNYGFSAGMVVRMFVSDLARGESSEDGDEGEGEDKQDSRHDHTKGADLFDASAFSLSQQLPVVSDGELMLSRALLRAARTVRDALLDEHVTAFDVLFYFYLVVPMLNEQHELMEAHELECDTASTAAASSVAPPPPRSPSRATPDVRSTLDEGEGSGEGHEQLHDAGGEERRKSQIDPVLVEEEEEEEEGGEGGEEGEAADGVGSKARAMGTYHDSLEPLRETASFASSSHSAATGRGRHGGRRRRGSLCGLRSSRRPSSGSSHSGSRRASADVPASLSGSGRSTQAFVPCEDELAHLTRLLIDFAVPETDAARVKAQLIRESGAGGSGAGGGVGGDEPPPQPVAWIQPEQWVELHRVDALASKVHDLCDICSTVCGSEEWREWSSRVRASAEDMPAVFAADMDKHNEDMLTFYRLLLLGAMRPDLFLSELHAFALARMPGSALGIDMPTPLLNQHKLQHAVSQAWVPAHHQLCDTGDSPQVCPLSPVLVLLDGEKQSSATFTDTLHLIRQAMYGVERGAGARSPSPRATTTASVSGAAAAGQGTAPSITRVCFGNLSEDYLQTVLERASASRTWVVCERIELQPELLPVLVSFALQSDADGMFQGFDDLVAGVRVPQQQGCHGRVFLVCDKDSRLPPSLVHACVPMCLTKEKSIMEHFQRTVLTFQREISAAEDDTTRLVLFSVALCHAALAFREDEQGE